MVLYYSATGNTQYIARELAKLLDDACLDLLPRVKQGNLSPVRSEKPFVICAPVYVCEMPRFLAKFLKALPLEGCRDVYFIFTSGGYCGISGGLAKHMMRRKKMHWHGHSEFTMPRNYVVSDAYPMLDTDQIAQRLALAKEKLVPVSRTISACGTLKARHIFLFEYLVTLPFNPPWCRYKLKAKDFYATGSCTGCSLCTRLCPLNNIRMESGKPSWGDTCTHCMACIGNCPTQAIEYGTITQTKDKYNLSRYAHLLNDSEFKR